MQREIEKSRSATDEYATFITETRSQSIDIDESNMTIRQALSNSNTFITIPATQTNIHAIARMGDIYMRTYVAHFQQVNAY